MHRIVAYITPGNDASIKVSANCGYKYEGTLRDMEFYKNRYWDGIVMAIIENDLKNNKPNNCFNLTNTAYLQVKQMQVPYKKKSYPWLLMSSAQKSGTDGAAYRAGARAHKREATTSVPLTMPCSRSGTLLHSVPAGHAVLADSHAGETGTFAAPS